MFYFIITFQAQRYACNICMRFLGLCNFYPIKITGYCMHTVNGAMLHHVESVEAIRDFNEFARSVDQISLFLPLTCKHIKVHE